MESNPNEAHGVKRQFDSFSSCGETEPQRKKITSPEITSGPSTPSPPNTSASIDAQASLPTEDQLFCFGMVRSNQPSSVILHFNFSNLGNRH